jgi:hypothetical protein
VLHGVDETVLQTLKEDEKKTAKQDNILTLPLRFSSGCKPDVQSLNSLIVLSDGRFDTLIQPYAGVEHADGNNSVEYDCFALRDSWENTAK